MSYQHILKQTYVLFMLEGMKNAVFKQLFLGPAMFETPSLHHFLLENVFKLTKSWVLKSWERDSTWAHRDACLHSRIHSFHALQEKLLDKKQEMEEENILGLRTQCWRKNQHLPDVWFHQFQQERWNQHC